MSARDDSHLNAVEAAAFRTAADLAEQRTGSPADQRVLLDFATQLRREANARERDGREADVTEPGDARDAHRVEVLTEGINALLKPSIAPDLLPGREWSIGVLMSVRDHLDDQQGDDAPDFFQAGHTYQRRRWQFQCLAVAPNPFNGETRAVGFLYRPGEPATATALDPDDWAHGGWGKAAEGGDGR